jgi:hypothetical protein
MAKQPIRIAAAVAVVAIGSAMAYCNEFGEFQQIAVTGEVAPGSGGRLRILVCQMKGRS